MDKNISSIFTKTNQSVKIVIAQEDWNGTLIIKIKFQSNKRYIMKKKEIKFYCQNKTIEFYKLET